MTTKKKWISRLLVLVMVLSLGLALPGQLAAPVSAKVTQQQIDALKQDANQLQQQKNDLKKQMAAIAADKNQALEQKNLLEQQIGVLQAQINNTTVQIAQYDQLIAQRTEDLAQAEADEEKQYELFCERVRYMEEEGEISYWSILFNSKSFSDLLDRFMMVEEIMEYDNAVMDQLIATREKIEADKAQLEQDRQERQKVKDEQMAAKTELKNQSSQVDALIQEIKGRQDLLEKAERELRAAADAMNAEIARKEKELAAQMAQNGTHIVSEAGFIWPLDKSKNVLSSLYGARKHPITGRPNNHTGIDILAPGGTPILAAKSGVVITSAYHRSYGNYVVVAHSNGQTTLYAHMSRRGCKEGDTVKQGQTIGYVGTTGSSNGNHLHYEVRVNGKRTDPLNYYKGSTLYVTHNWKPVPLKF